MKTTTLISLKARGPIVAAVAVLIGLAAFPLGTSAKMSKAILSDADGGVISGGSPSTRQGIKIEAIESDSGKKNPKEVAWLGISTPKAGLQKYDVLVEMGDQLLVHPHQLRKLVRLQKEGDTIKLSFYRGGKKQTVSATLGKTLDRADAAEDMLHGMQLKLSDPKLAETLRGNMGNLHEAISHARYDKSTNLDLERSMEEARQALHQALMRNGGLTWVIGPDVTNLEAFAGSGIDVSKGTTVTVKKNAKSAKSIAKADESGTYVIVANPKKRLTVHDHEGKLVFDGEIETTDQQQKVPAEIWSKAKAMLDEMGPAKDDNSAPEARSPNDQNSESSSHSRG